MEEMMGMGKEVIVGKRFWYGEEVMDLRVIFSLPQTWSWSSNSSW